MYNNGLPPNLSADDPSLSFTCKGIDIMLAACTSELGFLANPVSTHMQSAEMHNQSVNSLALLSARYTAESMEVANQLTAGYLFVVCQALDLRVREVRFLGRLRPVLLSWIDSCYCILNPSNKPIDNQLLDSFTTELFTVWAESSRLDVVSRCRSAADSLIKFMISNPLDHKQCSANGVSGDAIFDDDQSPLHAHDQDVISLRALRTQKIALAYLLESTYMEVRDELFADYKTITPSYLGQGTRKLYKFIRVDLGVPFHRGLVDHPTYEIRPGAAQQPSVPAAERKNIGSWIGDICEAVKNGRIYEVICDA